LCVHKWISIAALSNGGQTPASGAKLTGTPSSSMFASAPLMDDMLLPIRICIS
jgi:hypothetical protein